MGGGGHYNKSCKNIAPPTVLLVQMKRRKCMKKKGKLVLSFMTLCLSLAVLVFGVYSATSVNYSAGGNVSYQLNDVFVNINTQLYRSTSTSLTDEYLLADNITTFEGDNTPSNVELVQTDNEDVSTYNPATGEVTNAGETVKGGAQFSLNYGSYSSTGNTSFAYYIVITVTNYGTETIYLELTNNIANPQALNSHIVISNDTQIEGRGEQASVDKVVVIGLALDDAASSANGEFNFAMNVTRTAPSATMTLSTVQNSALADTVSFKSYGSQTKGVVSNATLYDFMEPDTMMVAMPMLQRIIFGAFADSASYAYYHMTIDNVDLQQNSSLLINFNSSCQNTNLSPVLVMGVNGHIEQQEAMLAISSAINMQPGSMFITIDEGVNGFELNLDDLSASVSSNTLQFTVIVGYLAQYDFVGDSIQTTFSASYTPTTSRTITIVDEDGSSVQEQTNIMHHSILEGGGDESEYFYDSNYANMIKFPLVPQQDMTIYKKQFENGKIYSFADIPQGETVDLYIADKKYATFTLESLQLLASAVNNIQTNMLVVDPSTYGITLSNTNNMAIYPNNSGGVEKFLLIFKATEINSDMNPEQLQGGWFLYISLTEDSIGLNCYFSYDSFKTARMAYSTTGEEFPFVDGHVNMD